MSGVEPWTDWPLAMGLPVLGDGGMSGRVKAWLAGGWLVLVVAGWAFTESINDGIEPTSGPRPEPSSSSSPKCPAAALPTPTPSTGPDRDVSDFYAEAELEPGVTVTDVACIVSD
ncbi:hypothetical protein ACWHLZ_42365 [Streptomyces chartreusis]|uniref:hypothetical protein n=1 Tax=Streptomyces TaxID=1883 RepID=UPI003406BB5A|nr:hypothetical protein OG938_23705 [Streptomyces chartreusis]WTA28470.1 hypothetical protein OIA45_21650 [Streptomyces chartreusis]